MIRSIFFVLFCSGMLWSCGETTSNGTSSTNQPDLKRQSNSSQATTFPEPMPSQPMEVNTQENGKGDNLDVAPEPINLGEVKEGERQIILFFPPSNEIQSYLQNESDDTGLILVEHFETESVRLIEKISNYGCNVNTVEMSDVYMLLADKSVFKVERNKDDRVCGVVLYQAGKSPKVLSGKLKAEAYVREVKSYFGIK